MDRYQKFLILVAIVAIIGIPVFVLDFTDISWKNNRESYWGIIAMLALIGFVLLNNHSSKLAKQIENSENKVRKELVDKESS